MRDNVVHLNKFFLRALAIGIGNGMIDKLTKTLVTKECLTQSTGDAFHNIEVSPLGEAQAYLLIIPFQSRLFIIYSAVLLSSLVTS
jgi:hypothetical protein